VAVSVARQNLGCGGAKNILEVTVELASFDSAGISKAELEARVFPFYQNLGTWIGDSLKRIGAGCHQVIGLPVCRY
jgi:hypothetical protein